MARADRSAPALRTVPDVTDVDLAPVIRACPFSTALIDAAGRLLAFSPAWLFAAITPSEALATHASGLDAPDERAALDRCLETGAAETVVRRPVDGRERHHRLHLHRHLHEGAPCIWAVATDVTEDHEACQASLRSRRRLELALQLDGTLVREADLLTGDVQVYGYDSDLVQRYAHRPNRSDDLSFVMSEDRAAVERELAASLAESRVFHLNYRMNRDDGEETYLRSIGEFTRGPDGSPHRVLSVIKDVTEEMKTRARIETLAYRDALTGLANRAMFQREFADVAQRTGRTEDAFGLVMIDVDHFKVVNDSLGHDTGDVLLRSLADAMSRAFRATDVVARLGGDEFAVIVRGVRTEAELQRPIQVLQQLMLEPIRHLGQSLSVGLSIGAVLHDGDRPSAAEDIFKQADIALYKAKLQGRNRLVVFSPEMQSETEDRLSVLREVRAGMARGEFVMHYQQLVDLTTDEVSGFEALMRWDHPQRGLLAPAAFMVALEDADLSVQLGEIALTAALKQMRAWLDEGLEFGRVAVNVASAQFRSGRLAEEIAARLRRWDVPAARLTVEITENVYLGSGSQAVAATIQALHDMGVHIALDDFGTGYASLTNLRHFPIDRLKIDKSFVQDSDGSVVRAVINLGSDLGMTVVAEGVETPDQLRALREQGCDHVQGYIFGRPRPASEVTGSLKKAG